MEWWNGGIVEWATMTNDPVPHQLICVCALFSSAQKGEREEQVRDVDSEKDREFH